MAKKNSHRNTKRANKTKIVDLYKDLFYMREKPVSEEFIQRFAGDLVEWAREDESALVFAQFLVQKRINKTTYYRWRDKYDILKKAHEFAMMCIAVRREKGGLLNKLNAKMVTFMQPHYCSDWKEAMEWKAKLKDNNKGMGNVTVLIDGIPTTDIVPLRNQIEAKSNQVSNETGDSKHIDQFI